MLTLHMKYCRLRPTSSVPHKIEVADNVTKVSIVGAGMQSNPAVAAKMFEALYEADINIKMISTSEIKISVLIDREQGVKAMNALSEAFINQ